MNLTNKQALFAREYLRDLNATAAARRAGYSARTADTKGPWLVKQPHIAAVIERERQAQLAAASVSAADVIGELKRIALLDIRGAFNEHGGLKPLSEMPDDAVRAIAGLEVEELSAGQGEDRAVVGHLRKIKLADKVRALEMLGRYLKLFTDRVEVTADESFAEMLKAARGRSAKR